MRYVHSRDVIHRDLKPSNILLDDSHEICIGDFGSSTLATLDATRTSERGTLAYMAPEQQGIEYTSKVDVYSFGLILYEVVTGEKVFPPTLGPFGICAAAREGRRPPIPDWVPTWVRMLIEESWSLDPEERPSFEDIFYEFRRHRFVLYPAGGVNVEAVRDYVCRIGPQ
jgi:serine/threonine protein kinase